MVTSGASGVPRGEPARKPMNCRQVRPAPPNPGRSVDPAESWLAHLDSPTPNGVEPAPLPITVARGIGRTQRPLGSYVSGGPLAVQRKQARRPMVNQRSVDVVVRVLAWLQRWLSIWLAGRSAPPRPTQRATPAPASAFATRWPVPTIRLRIRRPRRLRGLRCPSRTAPSRSCCP